MRRAVDRRRGLLAALALAGSRRRPASAGEPDPKTYWDVNDIRPGMKGTGQTVMVGTKLEEFGAEVLGVMRGVSPGRDMVLCRLTGCNLEHAGIIQGMSGSPIYIDGKLLGAVAFAWEFAKDPIAGVTPFSADGPVRPVERPADRGRGEGPGKATPAARPADASRLAPDRRAGDRRSRGSTAAPIAGLGRGAGRDEADRHAAGGVGVQPPGPGAPRASGSGRSAWRRWPAGRRPSGSSARRGTSRSCPAPR